MRGPLVGRESRLALSLLGEALGPNLQPDYNLMDMGEIFMGSSNCYQVRSRQPEQLLLLISRLKAWNVLGSRLKVEPGGPDV